MTRQHSPNGSASHLTTLTFDREIAAPVLDQAAGVIVSGKTSIVPSLVWVGKRGSIVLVTG